MDYLNEVNRLYPIRKTKGEKKKFRQYVIKEAESCGKSAKLETVGKHNNIVIGDVKNAKAIFTAHYDTPATSIVPNLMMPRNPVLCYLYHFSYPFILAMLSLLAAAALKLAFSLDMTVYIIIYIALYLGVFYLCTRTFKNKNNKNDNTSGVSTVLSLMQKTERDDIAFVLFDNEEKGLLGSKAFNKIHKDELEATPVLNLDCVGFGKNIIFIAKPEAERIPEYQKLQIAFARDEEYNTHFFPMKGSVGSSDHKRFKCGIGVMSCKRSKFIGYYTSRIHTNFDTVADVANVEFLTERFGAFIKSL